MLRISVVMQADVPGWGLTAHTVAPFGVMKGRHGNRLLAPEVLTDVPSIRPVLSRMVTGKDTGWSAGDDYVSQGGSDEAPAIDWLGLYCANIEFVINKLKDTASALEDAATMAEINGNSGEAQALQALAEDYWMEAEEGELHLATGACSQSGQSGDDIESPFLP